MFAAQAGGLDEGMIDVSHSTAYHDGVSVDDVISLYRRLIEHWNGREADAFAACFTEDGTSVGFDGSVVSGRSEIGSHLAGIFDDHLTATYVAAVRDVCSLAENVILLRADVGMVPPGADDLNPAANAIHSIVAHRDGEVWRIVLLQNTPAAFHGRPEAVTEFTERLRDETSRGATITDGADRIDPSGLPPVS